MFLEVYFAQNCLEGRFRFLQKKATLRNNKNKNDL